MLGVSLVLEYVQRIREQYLQSVVNTSFAEQKPYVLETPVGNQIMQSRKLTKYRATDSLNTNKYILGGR
jgi:hypothetical protein